MDISDLAKRIASGERRALARGITLAESARSDHRAQTAALIQALPKDRQALRIGLSGTPGVGKSTFINAIDSSLRLKTQELSDYSGKGQHTTTFAEMFDLSFDAKIIDTPGIKGFGLIDIKKEELNHYFPEMFALLDGCKFHNCSHINEPKCAVKEAVEKGEIAASRYKNYLMIYEDDDNPYRTAIY